MATPVRTKTITWGDPLDLAALARGRTGLEFLRDLIARGEAPPIGALLDFALVEVDDGRAVFEGLPGEQHYNPLGMVHGGLASTLLDSALGCAVATRLPAGSAYTTLQLNVHFTRAMTRETGPVRAIADAIHVGRTMGTAEGRIEDDEGRVLAHGTTTCLVFRLPGASVPP